MMLGKNSNEHFGESNTYFSFLCTYFLIFFTLNIYKEEKGNACF